MDIRRISKEDAWQIRHEVMWPDRELDYVKLPDDGQGIHYGLFVEGRLVSAVSLFVEQDTAQFRKFATLEQEQGKGYGSKLLSHVMNEARAQGIGRIWCNARQSKAGFYAKFGLKETDQRFAKGGIEYVIMETST
ncbi:GNAT family N-acetyltransferase [Paenibacillus filicis]|uniref:GNAT family N-acetyltransferase n=1 Tax=Paenibacillus filicis TaxID=669464 RepID=A0ABU9DMB6_9BACL